MNRVYQLAIFFVFALYFQYTLSNQFYFQTDPCHLMHNGRSLYRSQNPDMPIPSNISNNPLSLNNPPIEFHLNKSVPEQYKSVFRAAALEWKNETKFELIHISDEFDHSDTKNRDFKNVIYWLNNDQYNVEDITLENGSAKIAAETFINVHPVNSSSSYTFIADVDIIVYEEQNVISKYIHWIFTRHLKRTGIEPPKNIDIVDLQNLFIDTLSNMSSDDFYEMITQMMKDKGIILSPNVNKEVIQSWLIPQMNAKIKDIEPLTSFEDLRVLMIKEYSLDLTSILNSSILLSNNMVHEFGHAAGLRHNNAPNSLMHSGLNINPIPLFFRDILIPKHIDGLALRGLSCSYDLETLKQTHL